MVHVRFTRLFLSNNSGCSSSGTIMCGSNCVLKSFYFAMCLQFFCLWTSTGGQTCINTGDNPDGSCSRSDSCRKEHSFDSEMKSCISTSMFPDSYYPPNSSPCNSERCESSQPVDASLVRENNDLSLSAPDLHSIDYADFAMNISWSHSYNPTEGYELRIKNDMSTVVCLCINSSDTRSVYVYSPYMEYYKDHTLTIEILMRTTDVPEDDIKSSATSMWPSSCLDINYNASTCALPVYPGPTDITAYKQNISSGSVFFDIEWTYQTEFVYPSVYYIDVYDPNDYTFMDYHTFTATNSASIQIGPFNSSVNYYVTIQPYVHCSGVANYTTGSTPLLGCGSLSRPINITNPPSSSSILPSLTTVPLPTPTASPAIVTTTTTLPPTPGGTALTQEHIIIGGSIAGGCTILIIILLFGIGIAIRRRCRSPPVPLSSPPPIPPSCKSIFIVHSSSADCMKDIKTYITCSLLESFNVVSFGDKFRGDVIEWIEMQVRKSDAVILVFTKELHSEWESETKSLVVRAMTRLIHSAVSEGTSDKYAIVVLDEESKSKYIPDNSYLQVMEKYVLGKKKSQADDLFRFVTKTRKFEYRERSPTSPTTSASTLSSDDVSSECTVSTGINISCSQDYLSDKSLNKSEECAHSQFSHSKLNTEQICSNQLLNVLQAPDH